MNQVKKLSLLGMILLCLAVVIVRLRGSSDLPPSTVIKASPSGRSGTDLGAGRLAQQPTILRAKPDGGEAEASPISSPREWKRTEAVDGAAAANQPPLYPTGTTFINPGWFDGPARSGGTAGATSEPRDRDPNRERARPDDTSSGPAAPSDSSNAAAPARAWPDQASYQVPAQPAIRPDVPPSGAISVPPRQLVTEANDSFWLMSQRVYGSGQYYKALFEHNRQRVASPDQIDAGIEIETPPLDELRALYPQLFRDSGRSSAARGS